MIPLRIQLNCFSESLVIWWGDPGGSFISLERLPYSAVHYGDLLGLINAPLIRLFSLGLTIQVENPLIYRSMTNDD